jgi:hypothetical protein
MHLSELFQGSANADRPVDLGAGHVLADGGQSIFKLRKIQVAMGINKHVIALGAGPAA